GNCFENLEGGEVQNSFSSGVFSSSIVLQTRMSMQMVKTVLHVARAASGRHSQGSTVGFMLDQGPRDRQPARAPPAFHAPISMERKCSAAGESVAPRRRTTPMVRDICGL